MIEYPNKKTCEYEVEDKEDYFVEEKKEGEEW